MSLYSANKDRITKSELRLAMENIKRIHFVGIGGVGMSGIAELFHNLGFEISGSDQTSSYVTDRLSENGIQVFIGHKASHVHGANAVVITTAIDAINPEIREAQRLGIAIIRRAEMLAELMRFKFGVAVAGTHGKTTTTSLVASLLTEDGLDPTYVIGGKLLSSSVNAKLGSGRFLVAEADESDASFLHLNPMLAIVTNIDQDHMETYDGSVTKLYETFVQFIHNLPFYGRVIVCGDDAGVQSILPNIRRKVINYGFNNKADIRAVNIEVKEMVTEFRVLRNSHTDLEICLNMPGRHNILNALAAIAIATELGVNDSCIINALRIFRGISRRFQQYGRLLINCKYVTLVDDYGHHPRELAATIEAAKSCSTRSRLVLCFQPHRYSRTHDLFDDFVLTLSQVDLLLLLPVYPAGEKLIDGATSLNLSDAVAKETGQEPVMIDEMDQTITTIEKHVKDNDLLLICGAGSIGNIAPKIAEIWRSE